MTIDADSAAGGGRKRHRGELWFGIGKVVGVGVLFVLFFLLAHSMVEHRFFEGGRYHENGTIGQ